MTEVEVEKLISMIEDIEAQLRKLGKPQEVLPACLLLIAYNARENKTTQGDFLKYVKEFVEAFGVFNYD